MRDLEFDVSFFHIHIVSFSFVQDTCIHGIEENLKKVTLDVGPAFLEMNLYASDYLHGNQNTLVMSVITTLLPVLWVRKLPVLMCLLPFDPKFVTLRVRPALMELNLYAPAYQQGPPDSSPTSHSLAPRFSPHFPLPGPQILYLHCPYLPVKPLGKNFLATIW